MTTTSDFRNNATIGWLASIGIHVGIVALLLFSIVFKPQIPPPPEYGMEVNFGFDDQGFGEEQSMTPPGENPTESASNEQVAEPEPPQPEQQTQEAPAPEEKLVSSDEGEDINIKTSEKPKEVVKPVENPKPADNSKPVVNKPNNASLYPSNTGKDGGGSNNGNKPGTVGDMGKPNGNPDVRGIYDGNGGSGNSGSLDMAGWKWDNKPKVNDESNEEGKIVFQIKVDEEGNIISVNVLEKTVSPSLVQKYRKEVEELSFSRTSGGNTGEGATGRITFIITSR